jgi:hypothetical protein
VHRPAILALNDAGSLERLLEAALYRRIQKSAGAAVAGQFGDIKL